MTVENCIKQYKQAKLRGDEKAMEGWKARAELKGAVIEEKEVKEKKEKSK